MSNSPKTPIVWDKWVAITANNWYSTERYLCGSQKAVFKSILDLTSSGLLPFARVGLGTVISKAVFTEKFQESHWVPKLWLFNWSNVLTNANSGSTHCPKVDYVPPKCLKRRKLWKLRYLYVDDISDSHFKNNYCSPHSTLLLLTSGLEASCSKTSARSPG